MYMRQLFMLDVSGVPGAGKTATVREVIRSLEQEFSHQNVVKFKEINGLKLTSPKQAFVELYSTVFSPMRISGNRAQELLELYFQSLERSNSSPTTMFIVIMDEIDLLVNKAQNILYSLFDWPNRPNSSLILIAIANTMDLPERVFSNKISSRLGLHRIDFSPYTYKMLSEMLSQKFSTCNFQKDAIELCSRKAGAISGDARQAISYCERAKEIAERRLSSTVTLEDAHKAIQEILSSERRSPFQGLSFHQLLFVVSTYKAIRSESPQMLVATLEQVMDMHLQLCRTFEIDQISEQQLRTISVILASMKILLLEDDTALWFHHVKFRSSVEDIKTQLLAYQSMNSSRWGASSAEWKAIDSIITQL